MAWNNFVLRSFSGDTPPTSWEQLLVKTKTIYLFWDISNNYNSFIEQFIFRCKDKRKYFDRTLFMQFRDRTIWTSNVWEFLRMQKSKLFLLHLRI